jgi:hypothetical protein
MIETLARMHLLIAALLMAGSGVVSAGLAASTYFLYERLEGKRAGRKASSKQRSDASPENPKAAQA